MADVLIGILLGLIGLAVCFAGLRVFFVALPFIGFVTGFFVGAAGVRAIWNDSFLSNFTGAIVGLIVGAVFGLLAYIFWYVGALLSAGSTGALLGSALMNGFGVSSGWVIAIVAIAVGVVFFLLALMLALPIWIVIVNTAFLGASAIVGSVLLIFNQIDRADLGYGVAWAAIEESWFWLIVWAVITVAGLGAQSRSITSVVLPEDRWSTAQP